MDPKTLARIALSVMDRATVPATDNELQATLAARRMLHAIVSGTLVVTSAKTPEQESAS